MDSLDARDLLGLEGMAAAEIQAILDRARSLKTSCRGDELNGRVVANIFFENSTRTRCSFEVAAVQLGAHPLNLSATGSSAAKGESLVDTANNIEAMGVDALVVRTGASGGAALVAKASGIPVINAGDGRHEHPTQALLDLFVLQERLGSLEGRRVAIVGDILNSRVARSNLHGLLAMGASVVLVGPPTLLDSSFESIHPTGGNATVEVSHDLDGVLEGVDAVMMLRIQRERASGGAISSDYRRLYGLTAQRARRMRPEQLILHPGPVNRGVEMDASVLDDLDKNAVLEQVTAGVLVRKAVLMRAIPV
ncbi:MAG: aspartate carbamoyltransferase catalytic subunit [Phycisphaerales bacterium]|jgi:aspartate carbamoyltransferase catalytic subunit|nr:aspartate carbamoyltransferase catalytic subunit [Phycisphaerales bacterium]